jgi:NhaC family Na+:H+ antiporter
MYRITFSNQEWAALLSVTLLSIALAVAFHMIMLLGFAPGLLLLLVLCRRKGVSAVDLWRMGRRGARKTKEVIIILLFVSMLLPMWELSGTIHEMVQLFLRFLSKEHFLLLAFFFMMLTSLLLGTAVGSLSALGIPMMSAAASLQLPPEIVAGALISGAFVGDRTSVFSSAYQLLSHTVEVPLYRQFRRLLPTTLLAVGASAAFYAIYDQVVIRSSSSFSRPLATGSDAEWWLALLPPALLFALVCVRIPIKYAFFSSICSAAAIACWNGVPLAVMMRCLWSGGEQIGGGIHSMVFLLLFIAMAGVYNGILEELQLVQPVLDRWLAGARSLVSYSWRTAAASLFIAAAACNQTLPIILAGRAFLSHWQKHYSREELARIMADSTMLFPGLIPWSILAAMCSTITKVPVWSYAPYAVFLWVLPIITLLVSFGKQARTKQTASAGEFF